ncbi:MAG: 50S ribosomal protein L4, partial [Candidatus Aenigmatarchaeota archaeon]
MKADVRDMDGEVTGEVDLPETFEEEIRPDIVKRAVLSAQSSRKQPNGTDPRSGIDTPAETPPKGSGRTRVRRYKGRRYHAAGRATFAPFTVGGRRAHPPKKEEVREEDINDKERKLAIRSVISATMNKNFVS